MEDHEKHLAIKIVLAVVIAEMVGAVAANFAAPSIGWYNGLEKPSYAPPAWVFTPAWIIMYALMGVAAAFVWNSRKERKRMALNAFAIQLEINAMWSIFFFGTRSLLLGFLDAILLWFAVWITLILFADVSKKAGLLMIPYLLWVTYASALSVSVWILNS